MPAGMAPRAVVQVEATVPARVAVEGAVTGAAVMVMAMAVGARERRQARAKSVRAIAEASEHTGRWTKARRR